MSIKYAPRICAILLCDYSKGRPIDPEMAKRRPANVLVPALPHRPGLCTVVPLSGTEPAHKVNYAVRIELGQPLPPPFQQKIWWAKCDMASSASFERLDLFRTERDQYGKRRYFQPILPEADFSRVRNGVLFGFGFGSLT